MLRNPKPNHKKTSKRKIPTGRCVRFPGLIQAAYDLGVHRNTLYLALSGKRTSDAYADVLKRYNELKGVKS